MEKLCRPTSKAFLNMAGRRMPTQSRAQLLISHRKD